MRGEVRAVDCLGPLGLVALEDQSVGCTITDPPYEAEAHTLQRRVKRPTATRSDAGRVVVVEPLAFAPISSWERAAVSAQIARVTRRWALVFCQAEGAHLWIAALKMAGMSYRRSAVWIKPSAQPQLSGDRPGMGYETIVLMHARGRSTWNGGGRAGVYTVGRDANAVHQTQKPVALMEALVRDFTDPGELVLDPFAGSGTTGVACRRLGRGFLGFERDAAHAARAQTRIDGSIEQLDFLPRSIEDDPRQISLPAQESR